MVWSTVTTKVSTTATTMFMTTVMTSVVTIEVNMGLTRDIGPKKVTLDGPSTRCSRGI